MASTEDLYNFIYGPGHSVPLPADAPTFGSVPTVSEYRRANPNVTGHDLLVLQARGVIRPDPSPPKSNVPSIWQPYPPAKTLNSLAVSQEQQDIMVAGDLALAGVAYGRVRIGGKLLMFLDDPPYTVAVWGWCFAGRAGIEEIETLFINGAEWTDGASVRHYTGQPGAANFGDVDSWVAAADGSYTDTGVYTHPVSGNQVADAYTVARFSSTHKIDGFPEASAIIKGMRVYDSREGHSKTDPTTWVYSVTPALALHDFCLSEEYGLGVSTNTTGFNTLANTNEATVGAGGARNTIGLYMGVNASVVDWVEALRAYCGGAFLRIEGSTAYVQQDRARSVTRTLTAAELGASITFRPATIKASPSHVRVWYTDTSAEPWVDAYAEAERSSWTNLAISDIRLPGIQNHEEANRAAIERINYQVLGRIAVGCSTNDEGLRDVPGDVLALTHPVGNLAGYEMRLLQTRFDGRGWSHEGVTYDAGVYSNSVVSGTPKPNPGLPNPLVEEDPTGATLTAVLWDDELGRTWQRARIEFTATDWPYAEQYEIQVTEAGTLRHDVLVPHEDGKDYDLQGPRVTAGTAYVLTVRTVGPYGLSAGDTDNLTPSSVAILPPTPTNVLATQTFTGVKIEWDAPASSGNIAAYAVRQGTNSDSISTWDSMRVITDYTSADQAFDDEPVASAWIRYFVRSISYTGDLSAALAYDAIDVKDTADGSPTSVNLSAVNWDDEHGRTWQRARIQFDAGTWAQATSYSIKLTAAGTEIFRTGVPHEDSASYDFEGPRIEGGVAHVLSIRTVAGKNDIGTAVTDNLTPSALSITPPDPQNIVATQGFGGVRVEWDPPSSAGNVAGYAVRRGTTSQTVSNWASLTVLNDNCADTHYDEENPPAGDSRYFVRSLSYTGDLSTGNTYGLVDVLEPDDALATGVSLTAVTWNDDGGRTWQKAKIAFSASTWALAKHYAVKVTDGSGGGSATSPTTVDFALALEVEETGEWGNNQGTPTITQGQALIGFVGIDSDLELTLSAYDIDYTDELQVFINDVSIGYCALFPTGWNTTPDVFSITAAQQTAGVQNIIRVQNKVPASYTWAIRDLTLSNVGTGTADSSPIFEAEVAHIAAQNYEILGPKLAAATEYFLYVRTVGPFGVSDTVSDSVTPSALSIDPPLPTNFAGVQTFTGVKLTWTPPASTGNVAGYAVRRGTTAHDISDWATLTVVSDLIDSTTITEENPAAATNAEYFLRTVAHTGALSSTLVSDPVSIKDPDDGEPQNVSLTAVDWVDEHGFTWQRGEITFDAGTWDIARHYKVEVTEAGAVRFATYVPHEASKSYTIEGPRVNPGTAYVLTVQTIGPHSISTGDTGNLTPSVNSVAPPVPTNLTAVQNGPGVLFQWEPSTDSDEGIVRGYEVRRGGAGQAWSSMTVVTDFCQGSEYFDTTWKGGNGNVGMRVKSISTAGVLSSSSAYYTTTFSDQDIYTPTGLTITDEQVTDADGFQRTRTKVEFDTVDYANGSGYRVRLEDTGPIPDEVLLDTTFAQVYPETYTVYTPFFATNYTLSVEIYVLGPDGEEGANPKTSTTSRSVSSISVDAPINAVTKQWDRTVEISWDPPSDETNIVAYTIRRGAKNTAWDSCTVVAERVDALRYVDTTAIAADDQYFLIRSIAYDGTLSSTGASVEADIFALDTTNLCPVGHFPSWQEGTTISPTSTVEYAADLWYVKRETTQNGWHVDRIPGRTDGYGEYALRMERNNGSTNVNKFILAYAWETSEIAHLWNQYLTVDCWLRTSTQFDTISQTSYPRFVLRTNTTTEGNYTDLATPSGDMAESVIQTDGVAMPLVNDGYMNWTRMTAAFPAVVPVDTVGMAIALEVSPNGTSGDAESIDVAEFQVLRGNLYNSLSGDPNREAPPYSAPSQSQVADHILRYFRYHHSTANPNLEYLMRVDPTESGSAPAKYDARF